MITLFRAVSQAELGDILHIGHFAEGTNSMMGKWFAESEQHALIWGNLLYPDGQFSLVSIHVPEQVLVTWYRIRNLDQIGDAVYVTLEQLAGYDIEVIS